MCKTQTNLDRPTANVVNEVELSQNKVDLHAVEICLIIIVVLMGLNLALRVYMMHNGRLKKKYTSRANELDKL